MKRLLYILLILAFSLPPVVINAQLDFDYNIFREFLNRGEYQKLYDEAMQLRKQLYGKNWKTDYFISKALCAAGKTDYSKSAFDYTLSTYKGTLSEKQFDFLLKERDACLVSPQTLTLPDEDMARFINIIENEQASSRGKLGYIVNCNEDPHAFEIDPAFRELDLTERLFSTDSAARAIKYYKNMLGTKYSVTASGRFLFIVMSTVSYTPGHIQNATKILEDAYNFYADFFELRKPDKFIAVYLMNSKENLQAAAMKVHGLTLSSKNIGYSCLSDLSLLGTSSFESLGTTKHELFHLMIRTDIGDIPGWLDEGIACLYETSLWANNSLTGEVRQWRTEVLYGIMVPRLESLITNNWEEFEVSGNRNPCDVAVNYSLAKHFAIYLQETGKLNEVVGAFENRTNVMVDLESDNMTDLQVLEKVFGKNIDEIQAGFDAWTEKVYSRVNTSRSRDAANDLLRYMYCCSKPDLCNTQSKLLGELDNQYQLPDQDAFIKQVNNLLMLARFTCH